MSPRTLCLLALGLLSVPASAADYMVLAKPGQLASAQAAAEDAGGTLGRSLSAIDAFVVSSDTSGFAASLESDASVVDIALNALAHQSEPTAAHRIDGGSITAAKAAASAGDEWFAGLQWSLDAVSAPDAWAEGYTGDGVRVCVIDSGVSSRHLDIAPNLNTKLSTSFVPGEAYDDVVSGDHGTHVAGIIGAADNGAGAIGIAPGAELVGVKVLSSYTGSGSFEGVAAGMVYSADVGCDIANMSLGGAYMKSGDTAFWTRTFTRVVKYADKKGTLIVASMGNDDIDLGRSANYIVTPGQIPGVVAVSALGPQGWGLDEDADLDVQAIYTNYGLKAVHHSGPGGNVDLAMYDAFLADPSDPDGYCTVDGVTAPCWALDLVFAPVPFVAPDGTEYSDWAWMAGTSMASPAVAGVAALACEELGSACSPSALRKVLKASSDDLGKPGKDALHGHGRVNAATAVE